MNSLSDFKAGDHVRGEDMTTIVTPTDQWDGDVYLIRVSTVYDLASWSEYAVEASTMADACTRAIQAHAELENRTVDYLRAVKAEVTEFRRVIQEQRFHALMPPSGE